MNYEAKVENNKYTNPLNGFTISELNKYCFFINKKNLEFYHIIIILYFPGEGLVPEPSDQEQARDRGGGRRPPAPPGPRRHRVRRGGRLRGPPPAHTAPVENDTSKIRKTTRKIRKTP